ncbi:MAG: glycosyltransferase family 4 protein [Candidatus Omnitrophica bacterium]|nr:glycosyltransferase family 4 protein [Candidatus Omnitrophota bacterium]
MRILFVCPEFAPNITGGPGIYLYYIIKYLLQLDERISIEVLTLSGKTEIGKDFQRLPVRIIKLKRLLPYKLRIPEFYIKANLFIYKNQDKYDLIHDNYNAVVVGKAPIVHMIHSTMLQELWCSEASGGNPVVSIFMFFIRKIYFFSLHCLEIVAFRKACAFIAPSKEVKEHLKSYFNITKDIFVIRYGLDADLFKPGAGLSKKYNILFAGRIVTRKGLKYLFRALELLRDTPLKVLFCGFGIDSISGFINELRKNTKHEIYLKNSISYLFMPDLYAQSDIVVLPSLYESFSLTAAEAMACGTPVIISNVGGPAEVFENGKGVIFAKARDPEDLARRISYLLNNPEERTRIGLAGREKVTRELSWFWSAAQTYGVYGVLLERYADLKRSARTVPDKRCPKE